MKVSIRHHRLFPGVSSLLLRPQEPQAFAPLLEPFSARRIWPRPLVIVSVDGHAPHRHLHANYGQMYTHPFVR